MSPKALLVPILSRDLHCNAHTEGLHFKTPTGRQLWKKVFEIGQDRGIDGFAENCDIPRMVRIMQQKGRGKVAGVRLNPNAPLAG